MVNAANKNNSPPLSPTSKISATNAQIKLKQIMKVIAGNKPGTNNSFGG